MNSGIFTHGSIYLRNFVRWQKIPFFRLFLRHRYPAKVCFRKIFAIGGGISFGGSGSLLAAFTFLWKKSADPKEAEKIRLKECLATADQMYDTYLIDTLVDFLQEKLLADFPDNAEILWRLARAMCDKAKLSKSRADRKRMMLEALSFAERALEIDGENYAVHKWYAILQHYCGECDGPKERIKKSHVVKEHLMKAIQLKPDDPTAVHILGVWYYTFADLPWYQRQLAALLFQQLPEAKFEDALDYFLQAESLSPNFYSQNSLMLAKTYMKLEQVDLAKEYLNRTVNYTVVTADDRRAHDEAYELAKKMKWDVLIG